MAITRPLLPPKAGYVEVIDSDGNHVYKPTAETLAKLEQEQQTEEMKLTTEEIKATMNILLDATSENESQAAAELRHAMQMFATTLTDESQMMEIPSVYPEYQVGKAYKTKDIFRYGTNSVGDPQLYQVLQPHTSAAEWTPDSATSLYKKVGVSEDGTPLWVQPLGATDAYNIGDQVMYNGKKYESVINANVWAPDVYPAGWSLIEDSTTEPEPGGSDDVPDFVQPTGAHDAYSIGDRVMYNGHIYESTINSNVWSPDAYPQGWTLIE